MSNLISALQKFRASSDTVNIKKEDLRDPKISEVFFIEDIFQRVMLIPEPAFE